MQDGPSPRRLGTTFGCSYYLLLPGPWRCTDIAAARTLQRPTLQRHTLQRHALHGHGHRCGAGIGAGRLPEPRDNLQPATLAASDTCSQRHLMRRDDPPLGPCGAAVQPPEEPTHGMSTRSSDGATLCRLARTRARRAFGLLHRPWSCLVCGATARPASTRAKVAHRNDGATN